MVGRWTRGRPRQKMLGWMMTDGWISAAATSAFLLNYLSAKLIWSSSKTRNYWLLVCSFDRQTIWTVFRQPDHLVCSFDHQTFWSVSSTTIPFVGLFFQPPDHLVCSFNHQTFWSVLLTTIPFGLFLRPPDHLLDCSFNRQTTWSVLLTTRPFGLLLRPSDHWVYSFDLQTTWSVLSTTRPFGLSFDHKSFHSTVGPSVRSSIPPFLVQRVGKMWNRMSAAIWWRRLWEKSVTEMLTSLNTRVGKNRNFF